MRKYSELRFGISGRKIISDKPMKKVVCDQKKIDICLNCENKKCKGECDKIKNKGEK